MNVKNNRLIRERDYGADALPQAFSISSEDEMAYHGAFFSLG